MRPPSFLTHRSIQSSKTFASSAAVAVFACAMLVLAGWMLGIEGLTSVLPGLPPMKANTAICLALLAAAIFVTTRMDAPRRWLVLLPVLAGTIAALSVAETWFATDFAIDQWLFAEVASPDNRHPGRMAPFTGMSIVLLAIAIAVRSNTRLSIVGRQACAILPLIFGMLAVVGHAYGVHYIPNATSPFATMAVPTALSMMALGLASLAAEPDAGVLRIIFADRAGGRFARLLLPVAILLPIVVGWLRLLGQEAGLYGTNFGVLMMVMVAILVLSIIAVLSARWLNRSEAALLEAQHTLERRVQERTFELETTVARLRAESVLREAAEEAHAESRALFQNALEFAPIGMAVVGLDGRWLRVNRALCAIVGYSEQELLKLTFQDITHPDDLGADLAQVSKLISGETPSFQMEKRYFRKNREMVWVMLSGSLVRDSENHPLYFVAQIEDISERRKVSQDLEGSRKLLTEVVAALPVPFSLKDQDTRWLMANDAMARYSGKSVEELIGKTDADLFGPEQAQIFKAEDARALAASEPIVIEGINITASGSEHWVLKYKRGIKLPDGRHLIAIAVTDISQHKEIEERLRKSEERFRSLTDLSADWYWEQDQDFRFTNLSGTVLDAIGLPTQSVLGRARWELPYENMTEADWAHHRALLEQHQPFRDLVLMRAIENGTRRYVSISGQPIFGEGGRFEGYRGVGRDISNQKHVEKELADSRRFLSDVIDAIPIPLSVKDDQRRLIIANAANSIFHGCGSNELVGKFDTDLYPSELAKQFWAEDDAVLESGEPLVEEQAFTTMSGQLRWVIKQKRRITLSDGRRWLIVTLLDITNRKLAELDLAESRRFLADLIDAIPVPITVKDDAGRFVIVNAAMGRLQGRSAAELQNKTDADFFSPERATSTTAEDEAVLATGVPFVAEQSFVTVSGESRWVLKHKRRIVSPDGKRWLINALLDITLRKQVELEVERSQKFLESVIEAIPQPVFVKDAQHRWVLLNSAFCELLGHERAELLGRSDPDVFSADWVERVWAEDDQVLSGSGAVIAGEMIDRRTDGRVRWMLKSKKRVTLPDDSKYIVGISMDITHLKQVEEALRKSDELHRLLAENSSDLISLLDPVGIIEYASPAAVGLLDMQPERLIGTLSTDLVHPDDVPRSLRLFADIVKKQVPVVFICRIRKAGGTWSWVETSFRAIRDAESGRTLQVIAVSRDINERVRVSNALNHFKYVLDNTLDMIFIYDAQTLRFNYVNEGAARALGIPRERLLGIAPWDLRTDILEKDYYKFIEPLQRGEIQSRQVETVFRRGDGTLMPVEVTMQLIRQPDEVDTFISVARDLTERKRIEQMKNDFVSTVSHELRTPVTSIRGSLGLLAGGVAGRIPKKALQLIEIANSNSERLIRLINDILDIEKIESGKMRFAMRRVALRTLLETPLAENRGYAEQFGVHFVVRGEIPDVSVRVDPDRIMQVMANLLSNAAKFSPRGSDVEISANASSASVRISVTDHGSGIPAEFQSRIFGKFSQADASDSRKMGGSGLGLSIAKAIIEKHSGTVSFSSTPGRTTFFFDLPLALAGQRSEDDARGSVPDPVET